MSKESQEVTDRFVDNFKELVGNRYIGLRYYSTQEKKVKKYNIQFGVKKHIKGTGRTDNPDFHFIAWDRNAKTYKSFSIANFRYVRFQEKFWTFSNIYDNDKLSRYKRLMTNRKIS